MATVTTRAASRVLEAPPPALHNGDRLTRDEFEERYQADPTLKKAELIEGVVFMPSPVRHKAHGKPHFDTITWLGRYATGTPGVEGGDNGSLRLDLDNEPQPDAYLLLLPELGGQVRFDAKGYIVAAPDLIGEITASTASYDLHDKLNVYRRIGVKEYVVWRVEDQAIDWFVSRHGKFEPLALSQGIYKSEAFPGLWLDVQALITGNLQQMAKVVEEGLASREHAAFLGSLGKQ